MCLYYQSSHDCSQAEHHCHLPQIRKYVLIDYGFLERFYRFALLFVIGALLNGQMGHRSSLSHHQQVKLDGGPLFGIDEVLTMEQYVQYAWSQLLDLPHSIKIQIVHLIILPCLPHLFVGIANHAILNLVIIRLSCSFLLKWLNSLRAWTCLNKKSPYTQTIACRDVKLQTNAVPPSLKMSSTFHFIQPPLSQARTSKLQARNSSLQYDQFSPTTGSLNREYRHYCKLFITRKL